MRKRDNKSEGGVREGKNKQDRKAKGARSDIKKGKEWKVSRKEGKIKSDEKAGAVREALKRAS